MTEIRNVIIYTDGACRRNPGPGGYGVVLISQEGRKELSGGFRLTTNNRMEIMAAIVGLENLKGKCRVTLYSDSEYLVKAISEGWAVRWKENNWMRTRNSKALNPDLWDRLLKLCAAHAVDFKWVRGHSSLAENERCDRLAVEAIRNPNLPPDSGYEKTAKSTPPRLL